MSRVQIFSESPISPSTQTREPRAFDQVLDREQEDDKGLVAAARTDDSLVQQDRADDRSSQPAVAQRPQAAEHQAQSPHAGDSDGPAGAAPAMSRAGSPRTKLPPPPKVGEALKPSAHYAISPIAGPQSLHDPRSASASPQPPSEHLRRSPHNGLLSPTTPQEPALLTPMSAPLPRKSLEHPPGYMQNPYAADLTPEQRFATQHGPVSPTLGYGTANGSNTGGILGSRSPSSIFSFSALTSPTSGGDRLPGGSMDNGGEDWWSVVGGWAKGMGKKVGEVESEVWRRINGENSTR